MKIFFPNAAPHYQGESSSKFRNYEAYDLRYVFIAEAVASVLETEKLLASSSLSCKQRQST